MVDCGPPQGAPRVHRLPASLCPPSTWLELFCEVSARYLTTLPIADITASVIHEWVWSNGWWKPTKENRSTGGKQPAQVPLYPPHIPRWLGIKPMLATTCLNRITTLVATIKVKLSLCPPQRHTRRVELQAPRILNIGIKLKMCPVTLPHWWQLCLSGQTM